MYPPNVLLLFFFIFTIDMIEPNIQSMTISIIADSKFECSQTTCPPFLNLNISTILSCRLACLTNEQCTAVTYYSSTSTCALFTDIYNRNGYVVSELNTTSMIMISGSRFPLSLFTLTTTNETVYSIWNTVMGGNGTVSGFGNSTGKFYPGQSAFKLFDKNNSTKYTNYGSCNITTKDVSCGLNTGFYLTPIRGASCLKSIRFITENSYPTRDPLTMTIEGSNSSSSSALIDGSSWTLIYNGSTGLDTNPGRNKFGIQQNISNSIWYYSYRILITSKRGNETCVSYSEVELIGY